jgi:hypothetical protein
MRQQGVTLYLEKLTRNHRIEFRHLIYCFRVRKMVEGGGFEPPKLSRQIYSLIPLATREPHQKERRIFFALQATVKRNCC